MLLEYKITPEYNNIALTPSLSVINIKDRLCNHHNDITWCAYVYASVVRIQTRNINENIIFISDKSYNFVALGLKYLNYLNHYSIWLLNFGSISIA